MSEITVNESFIGPDGVRVSIVSIDYIDQIVSVQPNGDCPRTLTFEEFKHRYRPA